MQPSKSKRSYSEKEAEGVLNSGIDLGMLIFCRVMMKYDVSTIPYPTFERISRDLSDRIAADANLAGEDVEAMLAKHIDTAIGKFK